MAVYFAISSFQKFRERPPAKRAVRAPGIDTRKENPGIGISYLTLSQKGAVSSNTVLHQLVSSDYDLKSPK